MPVYLVTAPTTPPTERLVEAPNVASARRHVAQSVLKVEIAKGPDLFRIAKAGGELEQSIPTVEDDSQPELPSEGGGPELAKADDKTTTKDK